MQCKMWKCCHQHAGKWACRLINKHTAVFPQKLNSCLGVCCRGASAHVAFAQPKVSCMALGWPLLYTIGTLQGPWLLVLVQQHHGTCWSCSGTGTRHLARHWRLWPAPNQECSQVMLLFTNSLLMLLFRVTCRTVEHLYWTTLCCFLHFLFI